MGIGIIWYIVHTVIYNRALRKHNPEIFDESRRQRYTGKRNKKVPVVVTKGQTPAWIMSFGLPLIPLFLVGVVITFVALIVDVFW